MTKLKQVIFWDFDGVLMNSNPVRDLGFQRVLQDFPQEQVALLMDFHQKNGGLSRYVKFRYFFETIRKESLSDEKLKLYTERFSEIMLSLLLDESLLIAKTVNFVKNNTNHFKMHIVSGSDGNELRTICKALQLTDFFISINGSPTPKKQLVHDILTQYKYDPKDCFLIGDSHNDYEAAEVNGIDFLGFGNSKIEALSTFKFAL